MKINFVTPFFYPVEGGAENHTFNLAKELIKRKHEVTVYTSNIDRYKKKLKEIDNIREIKIIRYNVWFKIGDFASFFPKVYRAINNSNSDIIHIHGYRNPHNLVALLTKKPCIMTLHWPNYPKGLRRKINDLIIPLFDATLGKLILKKCKALIALNKAEKNWIKSKFDIGNQKIKIIPNGITKEALKIQNKLTFRKKYHIEKNKTMVLCIGRMHRSKGFDQVIKIAKYFPKIQFVIMGLRDEDTEQIKESVKQEKNILVLIDKNDKEKYEALAAADIFIVPSHYEAFGIVVLEAFTQKCAVIVSDQGGLPDTVDNAGLIFKINNLEDLKKQLTKLIQDKKLRTKLQEAGYKRVKNFTWDNITNKVENLYKEILQQRI